MPTCQSYQIWEQIESVLVIDIRRCQQGNRILKEYNISVKSNLTKTEFYAFEAFYRYGP